MFGVLPALLLLSLAASSSAIPPHRGAHHRRHNAIGHNVSFVPRNTPYTLKEHHAGANFFDGWDFFTDEDPTHGLVNFVSGDAAKKLAYVQDDGTVVMAVDPSDGIPAGGKRNSIRISTKIGYKRGLFIADIYSMPHGCSIWPAYWSLGNGKDWPLAGEIDIIEGINQYTNNQITLHTGDGCVLDKAADALGQMLSTNCPSSNGDNAGCAWRQKEDTTFGHGFNVGAGGVFAHTIEDDISVWYFKRDEIPADIQAQKPDPSKWGTPTAFFPGSTCNIGAHFLDQHLIFDITVCGDWAGPAFSAPDSGCSGTCSDAVANPDNFKFAQWKIASVSIYQ